MLTAERELAAAIYLLYAMDCVYWLEEGQAAVTRNYDGTWKLHRWAEGTYTLLGKMPVVVNPADLRPAFARLPADCSAPNQFVDGLLQRRLSTGGLLTNLSALGAINLLLFLPLLLSTTLIPIPWSVSVTFAASIQMAICIEFFLQGRHWRQIDCAGFWREFVPLLVNPIAALRCNDVLLRGYSELELTNDSGRLFEHPPSQEQ